MARREADLVLHGGRIWTGARGAPERGGPPDETAHALAALHGVIVAVGTDAEAGEWIGPRTRVVDLRGRRAVPGFQDAHVHFMQGGRSLAEIQLRDARSPEETRDRIAARAAQSAPGRWITGGRWDHEAWSPPHLPSRSLIDGVTPTHPVLVNRLDGHMALANSVALARAGITRATPDPPGGVIVRDDEGEPTGLLKDAAMDLVSRLVPPASPDDIAGAVRAALAHAASLGVTGVADMSASPDVVAAYQALDACGDLLVRIAAHQPLGDWRALAAVGVRAGFGSERLTLGALKGFADGSLGSSTALFFDPYADDPGTCGLPGDDMIPASRLRENVAGADRAGLQVALHAIGDRANAAVLDVFEDTLSAHGARDRRFRIEHAQHLRAADVPRFARLGVIASMQPAHLIDDGRWAEKRIGAERLPGAYAFRSLRAAGATLAFGSDWPVAPLDPLLGVFAAVTRRTVDGRHPEGWVPEEKIHVMEALRAYTTGAASASFREHVTGSLEEGKCADVAVLSADVFAIDPSAIGEVRVDMTVFDGRVVFERPGAE